MYVFLDFEASSLSDHSYPIEAGWVFEDGRTETHLIKPAPNWTDWDPKAEAVHHISRAALEAEGTPHDVVARRLLDTLAAHRVFATAPSWDGKWLSALLRAAGLPRHAMRLEDSDEAHVEAARAALQPVVAPAALDAAAADIVQRARTAVQGRVLHRALDDAEQERRVWVEVRRLADEEAARRRSKHPS